MSQTFLITGGAGFIGFHCAKTLLDQGHTVVAIDNMNPYYDVALKHARNKILQGYPNYHFVQADIADRDVVMALTQQFPQIDVIIHLAAQAGVRYSLKNPHVYVESNLIGQANMLELAKALPALKNFVFASTSSVYGDNEKLPFAVQDRTDTPMSFYAATKKSGEVMAYSYAHLWKIPVTVLRFFTVYGPWGRPDMALFSFTKAILADQPITIFNNGQMRRNFTYIDDIVQGVIKAAGQPPKAHGAKPAYAVYNIGNNKSENLMDFIAALEHYLGKTAIKEYAPIQPGDVPDTIADIDSTVQDLGFSPTTNIDDGIRHFVTWYKEHYHDTSAT